MDGITLSELFKSRCKIGFDMMVFDNFNKLQFYTKSKGIHITLHTQVKTCGNMQVLVCSNCVCCIKLYK